MSMNKMFKKVLAVVAAGAMTMGMAMPTFAADEGKTTEAWITKTYNTEVGKAEKFSFTAEQVKTGTGIITTDAAVTMPEISFTDTETGTISKRGQITFPTYPEAGKYEYTVKETQTADPAVVNGEHEKMIMSQAEYTMDVYVTDGATIAGTAADILNPIFLHFAGNSGFYQNREIWAVLLAFLFCIFNFGGGIFLSQKQLDISEG